MANLTLICQNTVLFANDRPRRSSIFCWPGSNVVYIIIFTQTIISTTLPLKWPDIIFQKLLFSIMINYYFSVEGINKN